MTSKLKILIHQLQLSTHIMYLVIATNIYRHIFLISQLKNQKPPE